VYVNVDHEPDVSSALGVTSIPTLYLVRDGKTVSKLSGSRSGAEVLSWLDAAIKQ
jgi:thioredoxin-like negative regulator of GroEL